MKELQYPFDPQMILRIGYTSEYGRNNAIRRDPADYISVY